MLDNRSFGGVQVSRTFYAKGQTGQQLLLGAYSALSRQISKGKVTMYNRHELMDVVTVDGKARGIIARNLVTGEVERHGAHAVVIVQWGIRKCVLLEHQRHGLQRVCCMEGPPPWSLHGQSQLHADSPHVHSGER